MNLGDLKLRTSRVLGVSVGTDDDAVDEDDFLTRLANEAVLDVLVRTRVHVRDGLVTFSSAATEFDVDDTILRMIGIKLNGNPLYEGGRDTLREDEFAFVGFSRIVLGTQTASGDQLQFWYTPKPTTMANASDDPSLFAFGRIPSQFHSALIDYMCWWAADKIGDVQAGRGERYRTTYEGQDALGGAGSSLGRIKLAINSRGGLQRTKRRREVLVGDVYDGYWRG